MIRDDLLLVNTALDNSGDHDALEALGRIIDAINEMQPLAHLGELVEAMPLDFTLYHADFVDGDLQHHEYNYNDIRGISHLADTAAAALEAAGIRAT